MTRVAMMTARAGLATMTFVAGLALAPPAIVHAADDTLAQAKNDYAAADYDDALRVLAGVNDAPTAPDAAEVAAYRVFCLVALGRDDEATQAIAAIVRANPQYQPSEAEASPRVRAFFERVRQPLLLDLARATYAQAKDAFDHHDLATAVAGFTQTIALLDEVSTPDDPGVGDLRTLAAGFRDLSASATHATHPAAEAVTPSTTDAGSALVDAPQAPPPTTAAAPRQAASANGASSAPASATSSVAAPSQASAQAPAPAQAASVVYGPEDADVTAPVTVSRTFPLWRPDPDLASQNFSGRLAIVVDTTGHVESARMEKSVHPSYDPLLLAATRAWTFRPATKNGAPVPYRLVIEVHLTRTSR